MSEHPVHNAFDYQTRHAERDFDAYLEGRPYQDANGGVHDPQTGKFIDSDKHFDQHRGELEQAGQTEAYENLSVPELARKLAATNFVQDPADPTTAESISEVLNDKLDTLDDKYFSDRDDSSTRSTRDPDSGINHNDLRSEKLWDRVMKIHDRELERLQEEKLQEEKKKAETEQQPQPPVPGVENGPDDEADKDKRPYKNSDGDFIANAANTVDYDQPEEPAEPKETPEPPTEPLPEIPGKEGSPKGASGTSERPSDKPEEGPWGRFKRGVWKHLYESPIIAPEGYEPMTPMGAPIQPDKPFDQWYAERNQSRGESNRGRRMLLAVGALAAAGVIALGLAKSTGDGNPNVAEPHFGNTPAKKGGAKLPGTPEVQPETEIRLEAGENPWTVSERILRERGDAHPTPAEIQAFDMDMAEENPDVYSYYGDSSRHIPTGTELKLPKK